MTSERLSGKLEMLATALEPIHHGAGTVGNFSKLRLQPMINPETGEEYAVPFLSGNSIKHLIRENGARFAIQAMGLESGALSKAVVDLLFSGGNLTKSGGSVNIADSRRLCALFPIVGICGYGAGNSMQAAKISVDNWHLVCDENRWRMPEKHRGLPNAEKRSGAYRVEEMTTRHDSLRDPSIARLLAPAELEAIDTQKVEKLKKGQKGVAVEKVKDSVQMIAKLQVVKAGAQFWGCVYYRDLTKLERAALTSAFTHACRGAIDGQFLYKVGAKTNGGFGGVKVEFTGSIREDVRAPDWTADASALPVKHGESSDLAEYVGHLKANRDEIVSLLEGAMK